jgi:hypothetical protein
MVAVSLLLAPGRRATEAVVARVHVDPRHGMVGNYRFSETVSRAL